MWNWVKNFVIRWISLKPLLEEDHPEKWKLLWIVLIGVFLLIFSTHSNQKLLKEYQFLLGEEKIVRSRYMEWKSRNTRYKLQSNITKKVAPYGIYPSKYPPNYIKLKK